MPGTKKFDVDALPAECREALVDMIWWLRRAPAEVRASALGVVRPYLDSKAPDPGQLTAAVSAAKKILRDAAGARS